MSKNREKNSYIILNICLFIIMFFLNSVYPHCWDDKTFIRRFSENGWGVNDVLSHSWWNYLHWSGKIVSLSIALFFTVIDKMAFNFVNSLIYVAFVNVICAFCSRKKYNSWFFLSIYAALWLFVPWFGTVILWIDGAVEYLWMLLPCLILGLLYYKGFSLNENKKKNIIGMFLLGILAGCGLEATGSALVFFLCLMIIIKKAKNVTIPLWEISGFIGTLIGFAILMLAPGNFERAHAVSQTSQIYSNFIYRFARESYFFVLYLTPLLAITLVLIMLLYRCKTNESISLCKTIKEKYIYIFEVCKEPIVLVLIALVSIYVMTFSPAFSVRIFLTPTVLLIIASGISVREILTTSRGASFLNQYNRIARFFVVAICIFVLVQMITAYVFCLHTGEPITKNIQYTNTINDVRLFE